AIAPPQLTDQLERLLHARLPLAVVRPVTRRGIFVQRLARADGEEGAAWRHDAQCRRHLRHDGGMIAKDWARHASAQPNASGAYCRRPEPGPGEAGLTVVTPGVKVVAHLEQIESCLFRCDGKVQQAVGSKLFWPGLPSKLQHPSRILSCHTSHRT